MQETHSWQSVVGNTLDRIPTVILIVIVLICLAVIFVKAWPIVQSHLSNVLSSAVHNGINGTTARIDKIEVLLEQIVIQQQIDGVLLATLDTQVKILMERRIHQIANLAIERRQKR